MLAVSKSSPFSLSPVAAMTEPDAPAALEEPSVAVAELSGRLAVAFPGNQYKSRFAPAAAPGKRQQAAALRKSPVASDTVNTHTIEVLAAEDINEVLHSVAAEPSSTDTLARAGIHMEAEEPGPHHNKSGERVPSEGPLSSHSLCMEEGMGALDSCENLRETGGFAALHQRNIFQVSFVKNCLSGFMFYYRTSPVCAGALCCSAQFDFKLPIASLLFVHNLFLGFKLARFESIEVLEPRLCHT